MKTKINNGGNLKYQVICLIIAAAFACFQSCQKYLDAKPDQSIATPATVDDLAGILNSYDFINSHFPAAGEVASDNYYISTANYNSLAERQRKFYTWQKYDDIGGDYTAPYAAIEYANVMLDELPKVTGGDLQTRNMVEGNGLFIRGSLHYALAQLFAKPYVGTTAAADPGIALRLTSDITVKPVRSTVAATYSSVIADLKKSLLYLPASTQLKYRASKPAAYGMLARVYLSMRDYPNAGLYADSALSLYHKLIDYNTLDTTAFIPFQQFNDEVIYDARTSQPPALSQSRARIDTDLYKSYLTNDLRLSLYFKPASGGFAFKGNYTGLNSGSLFTGIATDELYLIKSEAQARTGNMSGALATLNALLKTRFQSGTYVPYGTSDPAQLLGIILTERRKELLFRGLRWSDLRRLNQEPSHSVTLYRNVNDTLFRLPPGSTRYVFEIDQNAVKLSNLVQNP